MKTESFLRLDGVKGDACDPRYKGWFVVLSFSVGDSGSPLGSLGQGSRGASQIGGAILQILFDSQFPKLDDAVRRGALSSGELDVLLNGVVTARIHFTGIIDASLFLAGGTPLTGSLRLDCMTKSDYTAPAPNRSTPGWKTTEAPRR
jgi:hypothetical protein